MRIEFREFNGKISCTDLFFDNNKSPFANFTHTGSYLDLLCGFLNKDFAYLYQFLEYATTNPDDTIAWDTEKLANYEYSEEKYNDDLIKELDKIMNKYKWGNFAPMLEKVLIYNKKPSLERLKAFYESNQEKLQGMLNYRGNISVDLARGVTVVEFNSLLKFVNYLLVVAITKNEQLKICKNCGKYFYPHTRSDAQYCNNSAPQNEHKSCKQYGGNKTYQDSLKKDPAKSLYRSIYMKKQMNIRRNPDIESYKTDFESFKKKAKRYKKGIKYGDCHKNEYIAWLQKQKGK